MVDLDDSLLSNKGTLRLPPGLSASNIDSVFGIHNGVLGALTANGSLLVYREDDNDDGDSELSLAPINLPNPKISHLTISGIDEICMSPMPSSSLNDQPPSSPRQHHIQTYLSFSSLLNSSPPLTIHSLLEPPTQLISNANTFTALLSTGSIYTWGDPRHQILGRTLTSDTTAGEPGLVTALDGVPISKIASGGWMTGAVSRDRDLYVWGRSAPGGQGGKKIRCLPGAVRTPSNEDEQEKQQKESEVALVDIEDGVDVVDVGVGAGHMLALTGDGRVFGVGENENGQLGVGDGDRYLEDWVEVDLGLEEGRTVVGVECGYWSSFVLVAAG